MRRLLATSTLVLVSLAACSSGTTPSGDPIPEENLVSVGSTLYASNCASCHGDDLRGTNQGPSHLSEVYEPGHHGDEAFQRAVLLGSQQHHWDFGPMPPVQGLDREQITAIVAFVRDRQQAEGFESYPP